MKLDTDPGVRVLVLKGAGDRAFATGTDIRQFLEFRTAEDALGYEARLTRVLSRLAGMSKPTIAMLQGDAIGGGLFIALACDLRLAAPHARFGVPVARTLGNFLAPLSLSLLVAALGPGRARELVLTARLLDAAEAKAVGLLDRIHPAPELASRARARRESRRAGPADPRGNEGSHPSHAGRVDASRSRRSHPLVLSQPRLPRRGTSLPRQAQTGLAGSLMALLGGIWWRRREQLGTRPRLGSRSCDRLVGGCSGRRPTPSDRPTSGSHFPPNQH